MKIENTQILLFGKPNAKKGRRMGVALSKGTDLQEAIRKAEKASKSIKVIEKQPEWNLPVLLDLLRIRKHKK